MFAERKGAWYCLICRHWGDGSCGHPPTSTLGWGQEMKDICWVRVVLKPVEDVEVTYTL